MPTPDFGSSGDGRGLPGASNPADELERAWSELLDGPDQGPAPHHDDQLPDDGGGSSDRAGLPAAGGLEDDVLSSLELSSDKEPPLQTPSLNPFGLDEQEIKFAHAYTLGWSLADAARYAGYQGGSSTGAKVRDRPHVTAEIQRHRRADVAQMSNGHDFRYTAGDLLGDMRAIIQANIVDALTFDEGGKPRMKLVSQMPHAVRRAIKKIKIGPKGDIEIELYDKLSAMRMLSAALGLRPKLRDPAEDPDELGDESGGAEILPPQNGTPTTIERMVTTQTVSFERIAKDNSDAIKRSIIPAAE